jgi:hypothetical protein
LRRSTRPAPANVDDWWSTIEEWEPLEADPSPLRGDNHGDQLTNEWRVVYADHPSL